MNVLFVADRWDPKDHSQASGVDYEVYHTLLREGANLSLVGPFDWQYSPLERILRGLHNRFFDTRLFKYPWKYFFKTSREVSRALKDHQPDLVVAKHAAPFVYADLGEYPLLYFCDSSVRWLKEQWKNHAAVTYLTMERWEARVIQKAAHVVSFSEANARVLINDYGLSEEKVSVMAIPASIPHDRVPETISARDKLQPVRLLLVGRDYHRKGVDTALEVVQILNERDIPAELRVVGLDGKEREHTRFLGLFNKTIPEELEGYLSQYQWADFLIHPARFEAAGIVPSEAAAFGVPTITNQTGGLATTVEDGRSGIVLPGGSPAAVYATAIEEFVLAPDRYQALCRTTRQRYEKELNWPALGGRLMKIARTAAG